MVVLHQPHEAWRVQSSQVADSPQTGRSPESGGPPPASAEAAHDPWPVVQSGHIPCAGPMAFPCSHIFVEGQNPHPAFATQSSQPKLARHGSLCVPASPRGARQASGLKSQFRHMAWDGPADVPRSQRPVFSHQPQPALPVQSAQVRLTLQGSRIPASALASREGAASGGGRASVPAVVPLSELTWASGCPGCGEPLSSWPVGVIRLDEQAAASTAETHRKRSGLMRPTLR
jgi:hypothetical protein